MYFKFPFSPGACTPKSSDFQEKLSRLRSSIGGLYEGGQFSSNGFSNAQNMRKQQLLLLMAQSWGHHQCRKGHHSQRNQQTATGALKGAGREGCSEQGKN